MKSLKELLDETGCLTRPGDEAMGISALSADSRDVRPGTLFVALCGLSVDGHQFIGEVIAKGCMAVVVERGRSSADQEGIRVVEVDDTAQALGKLAAAFYGYPALGMTMIGITGTNGKTTSSYLLESMFRGAGGEPGVIGTVNYRYGGVAYPAPHTTPEPIALQRLLAEMAGAGVTHVIMEVSSHALIQKRVAGLSFDVALFTNLSRDHLDFHGSMADYFEAKKILFSRYLKKDGRAVVVVHGKKNGLDSEANGWSRRMLRELENGGTENVISCGMTGQKVSVSRFYFDLSGTQAEIRVPNGHVQLSSSLVGEFNLRNMLGAVGVGVALNLSAGTIGRTLSASGAIPGRLERIAVKEARPQGAAVFVDYAHTPDALENVLLTLRELQPQRLIVVFGCGGDRDRGKRPLMGEIAGRLADVVLLTSDNPRNEDPGLILAEIEQGLRKISISRVDHGLLLRGLKTKGFDIIISRAQAIETAIRNSRAGDIVLISGKGHEQYQLSRQGKIFFDDRLEAAKCLVPSSRAIIEERGE